MRLTRNAIMIAVLGLSLAAKAQQSSPDVSPAPGATPPGPSNSGQPQVDESALRYFASQGDTNRVNAEIARLRALYPNWTPPSDLSQLSNTYSDPLIERLWDLYKENQIAEIRAAIAERQASNPEWKPPEDLLTALETAEARRRLVNASDAGQWRTVLSVATETPSLLTCLNVDVLWRVAEAFAKTDQVGRTADVYTYLLTNCADPGERLATLQKALTTLPDQEVASLLRFERKDAAPPDDFTPIRDELARRRVERTSTDSSQTASAEDLAVVEKLARDSSEPGNVLLLGWYNYHHGNPAKALDLFKAALDRNAGEKAAEGYAMALRDLDRLVEAEAFAYDWREKAPENMKIYLDVLTALLSQDPPVRLDARVIGRIVPVVVGQRFIDGAQALGWYSYNTNQFRTAREWFREALKWNPEHEPSAYGLALATQRLNDRAGFNAIVAEWRSRSQRIADLADGRSADKTMPPPQHASLPSTDERGEPEVDIVRQPLRSRYVSSQGDAPYADERPLPPAAARVRVIPEQTSSTGRRGCTFTRNPRSLSASAALAQGWCLMELNRPLEAVDAFDHAIEKGNGRIREEAAYGKSLAYLRKDLTAEAAIAAAEAPQSRERSVELGASILEQRAIAAYRGGRYTEALLALSERARIVPEQTNLMMIRGWSYFKLGRYKDAEKIFRAVQRTGYSAEASAGLNAILETTKMVR